MKKNKWFTLLELVMVIAIISIVSVSILNMRNTRQDNTERDAVNIIHKEMDRHLKDFQRNKVWIDSDKIDHEINYFHLNFFSTNRETQDTLSVGNLYIYDNTWHFDATTLISWQKYSAFQYIKWAEKYFFSIQWNQLYPVLISDKWHIFSWSIDDAVAWNELEWTNLSTYNLVICAWQSKNNQRPIWQITINAISKTSKLERCNSNWINCWPCN